MIFDLFFFVNQKNDEFEEKESPRKGQPFIVQ
jgi:hypothetical protein